MIVRRVDSAGDWSFGKGNSDYARDEQAVEQNVLARLLSWVGDCFFALHEGIDWKSRLDVGQQATLVAEIKGVIVQSFGVVGVQSVDVEFDPVTRQMNLSYEMTTIYSPSFQQTIKAAAGPGD